MCRQSCLSIRIPSKNSLTLLGLILLVSVPMMARRPSYKIASKTGPIIVCVSRPTDSRGEIVYENQGETQKDQPVVAGVYVPISPIKLPPPKYPKSRKKAHAAGNVRVEGVIAQNGEFIDAKVVDGDDPDFSQSALEAVARYRFKPATLDDKPVAVFVRVNVSFQIRK